MPLEVGSRLGPYEITGPLGAGGMGEVYRAKDTRLDRSVAIKILPPHLSGDLGGCYPYDLAPDGKRFAVVLNPGTAEDSSVKPRDSVLVVLNFFDELRRKFPAAGN